MRAFDGVALIENGIVRGDSGKREIFSFVIRLFKTGSCYKETIKSNYGEMRKTKKLCEYFPHNIVIQHFFFTSDLTQLGKNKRKKEWLGSNSL